MGFRKLGEPFKTFGRPGALLGDSKGSRGFLPLDMPSLELWLDASRPLYQDVAQLTLATADGDPVGAWPDQSGNNRDVSVVAANAPTLALNAQNGIPNVRFDGVNEYLRATFSVTQPYTLFMAMLQDAFNGRQFIGGVTANAGAIFQNAPAPNIALFAGAILGNNGNFAMDTFGILHAEFNGANSSLIVNETAALTGNAGANNPGGVTLASNNGLAAFADIDIGEVIIYDGILSVANRNKVRDYLNLKWAAY